MEVRGTPIGVEANLAPAGVQIAGRFVKGVVGIREPRMDRPLFWQLLELFFAPPAYLKFFGSCIPFAPAILLELMRPSRDS